MGLGVTPSAWTSGYKAIQIQGGALNSQATSQLDLSQNFYNGGGTNLYTTTGAASLYRQDAGAHKFFNAPSGTAGNAITFTQAMTLDSSGNLLVGTTSQISVGRICLAFSGSTNYGWVSNDTGGGTGSQHLRFLSAGTAVGNINTTTTATAYSTSSDYRLKENIAPMKGALATVAQLKPCTYTWKADGSDGQGFIAHELAEVCPHAVVGEKDAVDAEGNPQYQGIDTSFLVATLTAALQEQQAIIDTLTNRITALEGAA
jgi:hypothetical protein